MTPDRLSCRIPSTHSISADPLALFPEDFSAEQVPLAPLRSDLAVSSYGKIAAHPQVPLYGERVIQGPSLHQASLHSIPQATRSVLQTNSLRHPLVQSRPSLRLIPGAAHCTMIRSGSLIPSAVRMRTRYMPEGLLTGRSTVMGIPASTITCCSCNNRPSGPRIRTVAGPNA